MNTSKILFLIFYLSFSSLFSANKVFVVGIGGAVGTGKSTIAKKLQKYFEKKGIRCSILAQDDYSKTLSQLTPEQVEEANFDDPARLDFQRFYQAIKLLKQGTPVPCPDFSFCNQTRPPGQFVKSGRIILVEGFHLYLEPQINEEFNLMFFLEIADDEVRKQRIIDRNKRDRGEIAEQSLERWDKHILLMYEKYDLPTKNLPGMIVVDTEKQGIEETCERMAENIEAKLRCEGAILQMPRPCSPLKL
jgi:uridine kinase